MVYVFTGGFTYQCAHLEISIAIGLARGLLAHGIPAKVVWASAEHAVIDGVEHLPLCSQSSPSPGPRDVALISNPNIVDAVLEHSWWQEVPRRGLFTSCEHEGKDWSAFDFILAENRHEVIARLFPGVRVVDCLMGCPEPDLSAPSPWAPGERVVFYCGRLPDYPKGSFERLRALWSLAEALPEFQFVVLTPTIEVPPELVLPAEAGVVLCPVPDEGPIKTRVQAEQAGVTYAYVPSRSFVEFAQRCLDRRNLRFLGARIWGTFYPWFHHAWCCLDFGFATEAIAPNTKLIDPLCAGARVVASGKSPSFPLLERYGAGVVVPHNDVAAMGAAIRALAPESVEARRSRSARFVAEEGWAAKVGRAIAQLGRGAFT